MCGIRKRFFPLDNLYILFFDVPISQWRFLRILVHPSKYWRAIMCSNLVIYFHRLLYHRQNSPWSRIPHWLCAFSLRRPLLTCFNLGIYFNSNRTTPRRRGPSTQRGSRSRSRHPPQVQLKSHVGWLKCNWIGEALGQQLLLHPPVPMFRIIWNTSIAALGNLRLFDMASVLNLVADHSTTYVYYITYSAYPAALEQSPATALVAEFNDM